MTIPRVESGFGGNSSCSSMASFMSELLQENFGKVEISLGQVHIEIVDDNAKVEVEPKAGMHRSRSLVTMRRQRSGRQLSRWACTYQRKDSDPNLMTMTRGPRRALRGASSSNTSNKMLTTTSDSMLLNLPTRTLSPNLSASGKSRTSKTIGTKGRLGNATWSNADVQKSTSRVAPSQLFDLSLDISVEEQKRNVNPNPFLMDRLSTVSLIDEAKCYLPMEPKLDTMGSSCSSSRSDIPAMKSAGIRQPVRRPSVQGAGAIPIDADEAEEEDDVVTPYQQQQQQSQSQRSKYENIISANAMDMLNSVTLSGSSSSVLAMTRIRDPSALGIHMPNRQNRGQLSMKQHNQRQTFSHSQSSGGISSSGMRRISSSSKGTGLSKFEESHQRSSSKSLNTKTFLDDPSLLGLNVKLGTR